MATAGAFSFAHLVGDSEHRRRRGHPTGACRLFPTEHCRRWLPVATFVPMRSVGLKNITLAPMHRIEDGINAVRVFIPKCWFDAQRCARGIDALKLYRAEIDERRADLSGAPLLKPHPVHDWTSHAADSFRYLALTLDRQATHSGFHRRIEYAQHGVV